MWELFDAADTVEDAMRVIKRSQPKLYFIDGPQLRAGKAADLVAPRSACLAPRRELSDFNLPPIDMYDDGLRHAVLVPGR